MSVALLALSPSVEWWLAQSVGQRIWAMSGLVALGAASYLLALFAVGIRPRQLRTPSSTF
jgi:putative peptidoglycan lipid II flippase